MVNNTKVLRGGSWVDLNGWGLRCSCRVNGQPALRLNVVGFRLVGEEKKHDK